MSVTMCILISIAVNLDNFLIGVNLGLKHQKLTLLSNLIIAGVTAVCSLLATGLSDMISDDLLFFSNLVGAAFLIVFGVFCLLKQEDDEKLMEKYKDLSLKKSFLLGLVLSINCIPPAFSAGIFNIPPLLMGAFSGVFSFLCMFVSNRFGRFFHKFSWIDKLTPISYLLLIAVGLIEIIISR